ANGLPTVATPIIIEGQGHTIERDTNAIDPFRLFHINSSGNLSLNEITLRKGRADLSATSGVRRGGAVMVASGEVTITNSVIADNQESAIYLLGPLSTATLDTVTMSGNNATAGGIGGAINAVIGGVLTIRNSIIVGNQQSYGGAIAMERADSQTIITNTIITGNDTTSTSGSGVYNNGSLSMVNSTIAGCFGNSSGGLFTGPDGVSTVVNSLIWGNLSNSGAQINTEGVLNISYSGIEGGVAGIIGSGVINDNGGNLSFNSSDSVFVDPVDPANAPTTDGNYHLAPNSVAIDQGSNAEAANAGLTTDIDGGDRIIGMTVDMGADEAACPQDGDDDGDGICNPLDICPLGNDSADADSDGVPDACDICPGFDDDTDADSDGVPDGCDACPGFDDAADADNDGVPNACDVCPGFDDTADADNDGVPDGCDICSGFDDTTDADTDGVPDGCDTCPGFDDAADADNDGVPDGCDACPDFDDTVDADNDGTPDACDACPGFDDSADADNDGVPDGCDICSGFDDTADADGDGVPDGCDVCPGFDDSADIDNDGVPDACDTDCSGFPVHVGTAQELVDAIQCANANPDTNTIFLDADITLAVVDNVTTGPNGLPAVVTPIVIEGQGHVIERDTNAAAPFRHFYVTSPGDLTINETTLQNGAADGTLSGHDSRGGAILVFSGHLTATNSVFAGNDGAGGGGAVYLRNNSAVATFDGVTMIGNIALNGGSGGAIEALQGGLLTIRNSVIAGNHGSFLGGAISMEGGNGQATITNTIISGNQGPNGIRNNGTLTLVNCTLAGNQGSTGGGLYTDASGHSTVINSVIWGNAAATESQVYCDGVLDVSYTGIEGGVAGISGAGAINDNGGNLDFGGADPVFIDPIDPASAPTTDGDYHLAANSAAVDAASNMEAVNAGLTTDFEGDDRIIGMTVDMGADEATCSLDGDDDGDGVCNSMDVCPAGDDTADMDSDGVPDGCDACAGFDDSLDADNDGVPDGCDICPGGDDTVDSDNNGTPDACDTACPGGAVGDVNTDGFVDTSDIVDFAAILLDPTMATADELCAADVNDDGVVDGLDVQGFVNLILAP
ncbi:MAG TPA: choice-of-anchor Q domain-containing protein, partial [Phycisphaerae bacterium]|nr:choice-of-anchor Q domain-containing protein [Phycisphaerae bacterium]